MTVGVVILILGHARREARRGLLSASRLAHGQRKFLASAAILFLGQAVLSSSCPCSTKSSGSFGCSARVSVSDVV